MVSPERIRIAAWLAISLLALGVVAATAGPVSPALENALQKLRDGSPRAAVGELERDVHAVRKLTVAGRFHVATVSRDPHRMFGNA